MADKNDDFISPFSIDKIAECFPFDSFRESQEEVLDDIITSFNSGVDVVLFRGDVGFGKSPVGICLGRMTDERMVFAGADGDEQEVPFGCYYTTPQKVLQDQLEKDFSSHINIIKGRSSYGCTVLPGNTCKNGLCQFDTKYKCEEVCEYRIARDAAVNGQIACYDNETKVLTKSGFKYFKDVDYSDEIATLSNNDTLEYQKPINVINYNYDGKMIKIKNMGVDFCVTPNHNMYVFPRSRRSNDWGFVKAGDLKNGIYVNSSCKKTRNFRIKKHCVYNGGIDVDTFVIPSKTGDKIVSDDTFLKFVGWYVSEGACVYDEEKSQYYVYIGQNDIMETEIPCLVELMGFKYNISNKSGKHNSLLIFDKEFVMYLIDNFGIGSKNKKLPDWIMSLCSHSLSILFDAMMKGDGHIIDSITTKFRSYVTSSDILAYQVMDISLKIGCASSMKYREPYVQADLNNVIFHNGNWDIYISSKDMYKKISSNDITEIDYSGMVGCVEVPNHIIFVERNGKSSWCGNCSNLMYLIVVPKFLFGARQLLIVDEVHSINDWALNHVGCVLNQRDIDGAIPNYKTYDEYIKWLDEVYLKLSNKYIELDTRLQELEVDGNNDFALGVKEARDAVALVFGKVGLILKDYEDTGEEWIWQIEDEGKKGERIKFEPITAGRFLDQIIWWRGEKKILMSGTIFPELFIEEAGLTDKVCEYREVPSIFPKENRPIYVWPVGKMTLYERENTIPKMIDRIAIISDKYPTDKGMVHCGTYKIAQDLYDGVVEILGEYKVALQDRDDREGSLRAWMESDEPVLFLSINMTEGLDLKDDLCRYQIIAKVQFGFLGDKRVKARMEMVKYTCDVCRKSIRTIRDLKDTVCKCGDGKLFVDMDIYVNYCSECDKRLITGAGRLIESDICSCGNPFTKTVVTIDGRYWYDCQAIIDLIQTYGRAVRTPEDFADMWILDLSFMALYKKRYTVFPRMFKEAVQIVK